jgi:nucleotide-binding universal stress UspA family protein
LAQAFGARVTVLHAQPFTLPWAFTPDMAMGIGPALAEARGGMRDEVEAEARSILPPQVLSAVNIDESLPPDAIVAAAASGAVDLIVMGSHGHGGLHRLLAGSVTEEVVQRSGCPILITRNKAGGSQELSLRTILCAVNSTKLAGRLATVCGSLAQAYDAQVIVMHVADIDSSEDAASGAQAARDLCAEVSARFAGRCKTVELVETGDAAERIITAARQTEADLVVVGALHRPFLDVTVIGPTTERVMRHAPTPVLVVPG